MSKSLGNVLDPFEVMEELGTDALRFYLSRDVPFGGDGTVGMDAVRSRYESELANDYGNLASRTVAMIRRYRDGVVPDVTVDTALAAAFDGLAERVAACLDRAEITTALEEIWSPRAALQPLRRGARAVAAGQGSRPAGELDATLASLAEGVRVLSVLLHPYMPESTGTLLDALGAPEIAYAGAAFSATAGAGPLPSSSRCSPSADTGWSTATPTCTCARGPRRAGRGAPRGGGDAGWSPWGPTARRVAPRSPPPRSSRGVYAAIGRHPNSATGFDDADLAELTELAAHERCVAIGETGLDYYRDGAPAEDQRRAFLAQIELARATGKPLVIHTRAADDETLELLDAHAGGLRVVLHCFSMAGRIEDCLGHEDWWISFAGNATYPKSAGPAARRAARARRADAGRDRRAVSDPPGGPRAAQPAGLRRPHRAGDGARTARSLSGVRPRDRGQRRRRLRVVRMAGRPARASASWARTSSPIRTSSG